NANPTNLTGLRSLPRASGPGVGVTAPANSPNRVPPIRLVAGIRFHVGQAAIEFLPLGGGQRLYQSSDDSADPLSLFGRLGNRQAAGVLDALDRHIRIESGKDK